MTRWISIELGAGLWDFVSSVLRPGLSFEKTIISALIIRITIIIISALMLSMAWRQATQALMRSNGGNCGTGFSIWTRIHYDYHYSVKTRDWEVYVVDLLWIQFSTCSLETLYEHFIDFSASQMFLYFTYRFAASRFSIWNDLSTTLRLSSTKLGQFKA